MLCRERRVFTSVRAATEEPTMPANSDWLVRMCQEIGDKLHALVHTQGAFQLDLVDPDQCRRVLGQFPRQGRIVRHQKKLVKGTGSNLRPAAGQMNRRFARRDDPDRLARRGLTTNDLGGIVRFRRRSVHH